MSFYGWVPCRWFVGVACMPYGLGVPSLSLASIACIELWSYGYKSRLLMDPLCIRGSRALSRDNFALLRRSKLVACLFLFREYVACLFHVSFFILALSCIHYWTVL